MPTNPYFNNYEAANEQTLIEDLIIEAIQIYGFDTYYMPRVLEDFDEVFREATASTYEDAFEIECYLKTNMGFEGDGKFMSDVLGHEIRDSMVITMAQRRFTDITTMDRPREGDLMYFPLDGKVYEIKFVDHQSVFYQMGKLMVYDLTVELLEYSGEQFNTGIDEIDSINTMFPMDGDEANDIEDAVDQSSEMEEEGDAILDWTEHDPFGNGGTL
jgi:hypothetical protein